jgi:hypothetical protein
MHRRILLFVPFLLGSGAALARAADTWLLVSDDEFQRDLAAPHHAPTRALTAAGAPRIEVVKPNSETQLPRPFSVRIRFVPQGDAAINLASFRAGYGWLDIDITKRMLEHAKLSADGLAADDVDAPAGEHRVNISIADTLGRVGTRSFKFAIV